MNLLLVCVMAGTASCTERPRVDDGPVQKVGKVEFERYFVAAAEQDAEKDRYKRCMRYPNPPGSDWSEALILAICGDHASPVEKGDRIQAMVGEEDWSGLQALYEGRLRKHHSGEDPERVLYRLFLSDLWPSLDDLDASSRRWLRAVPESPYAKTLRAEALLRLAWKARGQGFVRDIPVSRIRKMRRLADQAIGLAESALESEAGLMPAYAIVMQASALNGRRNALQLLRRALEVSPDSYYMRLAVLPYLQPKWGGRLEDMERVVDDAQELSTVNARMPLLKTWQVSFSAGDYNAPDRYAPALKTFREAMAFGPEYSTMYEAVWLAAQADQYAESAVIASQLIRLNGKTIYALSKRAWAFEMAGDWPRALNDYMAAAERDPGNSDHLERIAGIHHGRRNFGVAEEYYLKALAMDPDNTRALRGACRMWVHLTLEPGKAEPYAQRLVGLLPDDPDAWLLLANVQHSLKRPEVRDTARRFLELAPPDDPEFAGPVKNIQRFLGDN
ncbi:tetratricopeptide repeat protein [Marilutibacter chinensis]|uniref:Tetratricopeptide repeat protein n=1 Tax=Marilutibacter chinensis TaxID=2912247 RepID=A0ABS9HNU0_9GAMM|nr:tetratricopeptide repeat protein [Lysobacter chinensis]MCF7220243.1 hypothetical protein [Lysobacter chinensis]